jgi:FKBP-type peptidyl-prolyl cis-trans isomerase
MEFDSTDKRRAPVTFAIASAIPGWREALQLMPVGSKWQLFVPSELAYGARGTRTARLRKNKKGAVAKQKIGPNATLIFELELLSLEDSPAAGTQQAQQDQNAVQDESSAPSKEMNQ